MTRGAHALPRRVYHLINLVNTYLLLTVKDDLHMYCGNNLVHVYKTTTNASDDRLKANEELIENVCYHDYYQI